MKLYKCPICNADLEPNKRHPNYVCPTCTKNATDKDGRKLVFSNASLSGGFIAWYQDTDEEYKSHTCYINGIECFANEAKFGGIVIQIK